MIESITIMNRLFWPRRLGGLENVLWQLTNTLAAQGTSVQVLTEQVDDAPADELAAQRLRVLRTPPVEFGRLWRVGELVQVRWWMRAIKAAPRTDWLWANEPTAAVAAILLGRGKDLIYRPVFCYAGMHHIAQTHPEMQRFTRSRIARALDRFAHHRARLVLTQSRNLQRQQQRWYSPRVNSIIIPNATTPPGPQQTTRDRFGLKADHFVIGFVGRPSDPCKDLPFLLSALTHAPLPDHARLMIVGDGEGMDTARDWVRRAGLEQRTVWTGNLHDTSPAYRAMDVLVLPSRFETFGNVIVEANVHGVPALGRRFCDHPDKPIYTACEELIDSGVTGYTVDPHDPADLSDKLHQLIDQPARAKQMGAAAASRHLAYRWSDVVARIEAALASNARPATPGPADPAVDLAPARA